MRRYKLLTVIAGLLVLIVAGVAAAPSAQEEIPFSLQAVNTRSDLEQLADVVLGPDTRPVDWTFNIGDAVSPNQLADRAAIAQFVLDFWFDNEQLADEVFGVGKRPPDWFGAIQSPDPELLARNVRHDLETSAETVFESPARPSGWQGGPAVFRCNRNLQNLITIANEELFVQLQTDPTSPFFCTQVDEELDLQLLAFAFFTPEVEEQLPEANLAVRGDIERLADERLGLFNRPLIWTGNVDPNSPNLAPDNFRDIEALADETLGQGNRPFGWIGEEGQHVNQTFRNTRHDIELLADDLLGRDVRPNGWQGFDPLVRCEPVVQNLVAALRMSDNVDFGVTASVDAVDFCNQVAVSANVAAEAQLGPDVLQGPQRFLAEAQYAFTYLDLAATQFMGIMPPDTEFRALYRNFGDSTMMFVSGSDFALYIDRRWTSLSEDIFEDLPTLEGVRPLTFCDAAWCNGPGPTPTATGFGPVEALIFLTTPPAPPSQEEIEGKTMVNFEHIRLTYLSDDPILGRAQVTLQICSEPEQLTCEPVNSIFDGNIGVPKAVINQVDGLNVYEFSYGYNPNLIIEGETLVSPDVWLDDPTFRVPSQ